MPVVSNADELDAITVSNNVEWNETFYLPSTFQELRGWSARMQLRRSADYPDTVLNLDTNRPSTGLRLEAAPKAVSIKVPASVMETIDPGEYERDIVLVSPDERTTLYGGRGKVTILRGITRT
jgi:hypothetical protein